MKLNKKIKAKNSWSILLLTLIMSLSFCMKAQAQEMTVTGIVTSSEDGLPIPGVAILVKGSSVGTLTDFDGNYSISVKSGNILLFSYLGMEGKSITVNSKNINVALNPSLEGLDEVIVIGYGTQSKKEIAGAVAQVKADDISQFVTTDVASAMQGQIAGVNITANSGEPGESSSIQIRGITSLSGSNEPLYVIDGIPQQQGYQLNLASNEIETIDVLKDAASAAVYGTRGSAGVILITTKRGEEGSMSISFDQSYGVQRLGGNIPLMNTEQQVYFETQQINYFTTLGLTGNNPGPTRPEWLTNETDPRDLVLVDNAENKNYNLNVSGGTKNFTYNVSGGFINTGGVLIGSNFKRYNGRASTTYNTDKWKISTSIGFTLDDRDRTTNGVLTNAIRYRPYFPAIDISADSFFTEEGNGGIETPLNTLIQNLKQKDNERIDRINTSLSITREITKDLSFTTRLGTNVTNSIRNIFRPRFELVDIIDGSTQVDPLKSGVSAEASRLNVFSWDGALNYKKTFGDHTFDVLAATSFDERSYQTFIAARNGVASNEIEVLDGSTQDQSADSGGVNYVSKNIGLLGRVQYNYKGKYMLSALIRQDGSSKFSDDYRWGNFPSLSAAWNVSDETFWEPLKPTVNNFKIRASHGTVGNDSFADYVFSSVISQERDYIFDPNDTFVNLGSAVVEYANAGVKWETSISNNIGIDLGFFKNKFTLSADYYVTKKEDMLFPVRLPGSTGVVDGQPQNLVLNIGNMTNKGLEIAAQYREKIGQSKLTLNATFTQNRNEITKIVDGNNLINNDGSNVLGNPTTVFAVGREAGAFYLHKTQGVIKNEDQLLEYRNLDSNANLGDLIYTDQLTVDTDNDGIPDMADGVINGLDRVYSGSGLPDYELGFNLKWNYKNFDFSMNWYASVGAEIINGTKADAFTRGRHQDLVNMWTPQNPTSNIPFYVDRDGRHPNYEGNTDLWLEDGDYLRLKLVTLGYSLPKDVTEKIGMSKLRLFLSTQNPLTITGYDGYDPEVGGNNVVRRGIDTSRFPLSSLYSIGVNLEF